MSNFLNTSNISFNTSEKLNLAVKLPKRGIEYLEERRTALRNRFRESESFKAY